MRKSLNNKGYMLVEIILASAIAMIVAYFIIDLTIKLKNNNDDLLVKTLVYTDQAIIYNEIAEDLYSLGSSVTCDYVKGKVAISDNTFTYNGFSNVITEYAKLGSLSCTQNGSKIYIKIPITVKQLPDEVFDINLIYTNGSI